MKKEVAVEAGIPPVPPVKPKPIKSRRKTKTYGSGTATYGSGTGTSDRVSSRGARRFNFTARDIEIQPIPEWQYLFAPSEWEQINSIDKEEVKKVITAYSFFGDTDELTKLFPSYDWRQEPITTRLKLLLYAIDRDSLPKVVQYYVAGTQERVYGLYDEYGCKRLKVFPIDTMISRYEEKERLILA